MNSKSIKVRDGVKTVPDKAKSRRVSLHLGAIMTFDTDSCESNTVEAREVEQSTNIPWSISEDYDGNNEARLLRYGNAAEALINSTRYDLDNESKHIEIRVLDEYSKDELSIRNMCKTYDITDESTISYHWEYSEGSSSPMGSIIAAAVSDPMTKR
ncbi:hypothetical protein FQA39_LY17162 [Lamprigera yunnana]|nr:hypothetical protein FQA39_LY17162 [Lamprigera yunnana]